MFSGLVFPTFYTKANGVFNANMTVIDDAHQKSATTRIVDDMISQYSAPRFSGDETYSGVLNICPMVGGGRTRCAAFLLSLLPRYDAAPVWMNTLCW